MTGARTTTSTLAARVAPPAARTMPHRVWRLAGLVLSRAQVQQVLSVLAVLAVWQLVGSHFPYSTSSPAAVARAAGSFTSEVLPGFADTLATFGLGFAICVVVGVPTGLAMARVRLARVALEPYVNLMYSLPMVSLLPVLIVAFGISFSLRVAATVLFGIFAIIVNTYMGASRVSAELEDTARAFVASPWKRLTTVVVPDSLPYIFAGIRIGFAHGMIGAIVIEMEASALGIGYLLQRDTLLLRVDKFFVVVVALGLFSILCTRLLRLVEHWFTRPWSRPRLAPQAWSHAPWRGLFQARQAWGHDPAAGPLTRGERRGPGRIWSRAVALCRAWFLRLSTSVQRTTRKPWVAWATRVVVLALLIGAWELKSATLNQAVLPAPASVARAVYRQVVQTHEIFGPLGQSIELLFAGFALAVAFGIPIGLAMGRWRWVENVLNPYVSFLYALPHVVFIPIFIIWLGFGFKFGLGYIVVSAIFPVIINTMHGVQALDQEYIAVGRTFCASQWQIVRTIVVPSTLPYMAVGARLAFSVAWIGVIVSEVLSTQQGLGGLITVYGSEYKTADMFVPVLFIMVISVAILQTATRLQPRLTPWFEPRSAR